MSRDVETLVHHCQPCQLSAKSSPPNPVPAIIVPQPNCTWKKLSIDITGPFDTAPVHQCFVIALIDHFSKFSLVLLTGDTSVPKITEWLDDVFSHYGLPSLLMSDNGPQFTSKLFSDFLTACNIKHILTPVYNPCTNGMVEVFNYYIKHGSQTFASQNVSFKKGTHDLLATFQATAPSPDSSSPAELMFRHQFCLPFQVVQWSQSATEPASQQSADSQIP